MGNKTYAPISIKEHEFKDGGSVLKVSFKADKLIAFANQHVNAKGYVNLVFARSKEVGKYGDTHYAYLDTWEPKPKVEPVDPPPAKNAKDSDDLPF